MNFSRRQPLQTRVLDLNAVIDTFYPILCRTIRENLALTLQLDSAGVFIEAEQSQIEQILLNLAINAQDAIAHKGEIVIATQRFSLGEDQLPPCADMLPGDYAQLKFCDNGCGMKPETLAHIFEPFYTTKEDGLGTGLGLTTVYAIVQTYGGALRVDSQPQRGTTFEIYFPLVSEPAAVKPQPVSPLLKTGDGQSVLLAEDDDMVRRMVHEMLTTANYRVQEAVDGASALALARSTETSFDLLVSDVVMPGLDGPELYAELRAFMPELKVLFISGYATNPHSRGRVAKIDPEIFLQKPFSAQDLLARVQKILRSD
jgi:CheY-like chemotaxis protein